MKKLILVTVLFTSGVAMAATAMWTGRSEYVTTVTGRFGIACQYNYFGRTFWKTFSGATCPMRVEVY